MHTESPFSSACSRSPLAAAKSGNLFPIFVIIFAIAMIFTWGRGRLPFLFSLVVCAFISSCLTGLVITFYSAPKQMVFLLMAIVGISAAPVR